MKIRKQIVPLLLTLAVAVTGGSAVYQTWRAQRLQRTLEEVCRSALYETVERMNALALDMEKLLISADAGQSAALLQRISRSAGDVQQHLTFLPLSHEAMAPTLAFANQLSDYSAALLPTLMAAGAVPEAELSRLSEQSALCTQLCSQLALAQQTVDERRLALALPGSVFALGGSAALRPLEALGDSQDGMNYPAMRYTGLFDASEAAPPRGLPPGEITEAQALVIAQEFIGADRVKSVRIAPGTLGAIPAYGVTVETEDVQLNLEITRKGGRVLWMMPETASFQVVESVQRCREAAADFLRTRGFADMEAVDHQVYDGLCVINFAPVQDGVRLYPDLVKVQIRMDTAQPVGLEAHLYWTNHVRRKLPAPAVTEESARAHAAGRAEVESVRLCMIPRHGSEVLCWELSLTHGGERYLVYLDAQTARELDIMKVILTPDGILTA